MILAFSTFGINIPTPPPFLTPVFDDLFLCRKLCVLDMKTSDSLFNHVSVSKTIDSSDMFSRNLTTHQTCFSYFDNSAGKT